jgi:hypothetical protein
MAYVNYQGIATGAGLGNAELGIKVSEQILPKLFAEVAYLKDYMVSGKYDFDGQEVASIVIPTLSRPRGRFKDMTKADFDPYNPTADRVNQGHIKLDIDKEYNEMIDCPEDMLVQNLIGNSIISTMADYVGKTIAENINYITASAMVTEANKYNSELSLARRKIEYVDPTSTTKSIPDSLAILKAKIGNADPAKGDTSFNGVPLSAVVSNTMEAYLLQTKNQFILESSYGQELLIEGTFGRITLGDNVSYRGKILGVQLFVLPDAFFPNTLANEEDFAEVPTSGSVLGIVGIAEATYRVFVDRGIKITDATKYRGWILQPLYRVGIKVAKPWGLGLLVSKDYVSENLQAEVRALTWEGGRVTSDFGPDEVAVYKAGEQVVTLGKAYSNGVEGWMTFEANNTDVAGTVTVAIVKDGVAVARNVHTVA